MQDFSSTKIYDFYDSIKEKDIEWLWYPYIPFGKLTLVEGDPGEGKSTLMLNIASLLSTGSPLPASITHIDPITVIYQCSEDDIADTIKPRLIQAGADCSKIAYIVDDDCSLCMDDIRIEETIRKTSARLLILDPIQSFLSHDADMSNAAKMRCLLGKLAAIAAKYKCAIVMIGHMNKSGRGKDLYRGLGSIDIPAISRSVLMVTRDEEDPTLRYVVQIKSSLAREGDVIGFHIQSGGNIRWVGNNEIRFRREDFLKESTHAKTDEIIAFLFQTLKNRPVPSADIFNKLRNYRISERTIYKIKKEMMIKSIKIDNVWYWRLPEEAML